MNTPAPTPYDITEIPRFAWEPGPTAWVALACILGIVGMILLRPRRARGLKSDQMVDSLVADLLSASKESGTVAIERAVRLGRRLASHLSGISLAELTCEELRSYPTEGLPWALRDAIRTLAQLEELEYSPPSAERDSEVSSTVLKLASQLSEYRLSMRPR